MRTCQMCDTVLSRKNVSGLCADHWHRHANIPEPELTPKPRVADIVTLVCDVFCVNRENLLGKSRKRVIMRPRHAAYYLAAMHSGRSLPIIARAMNRKCHSAVIHGRDLAKDMIKRDEAFRAKIEKIEKSLAVYSKPVHLTGVDIPVPAMAEPEVDVIDPEPERDTDEWFSWALRNDVRAAA